MAACFLAKSLLGILRICLIFIAINLCLKIVLQLFCVMTNYASRAAQSVGRFKRDIYLYICILLQCTVALQQYQLQPMIY